ncbi:MAG: RHS repeat-associated core domain-containing protein [Thermoanaerobaculia bacterium]
MYTHRSNGDYDHARSHHPFVGRFLSPDKLHGRLANPQTWNRYLYAGNNPLKYVDRTGLDFVLSGCANGNETQCKQQTQLGREVGSGLHNTL